MEEQLYLLACCYSMNVLLWEKINKYSKIVWGVKACVPFATYAANKPKKKGREKVPNKMLKVA